MAMIISLLLLLSLLLFHCIEHNMLYGMQYTVKIFIYVKHLLLMLSLKY